MQNLRLSYVSVLFVIEEEKCFATQTRPEFSRCLRMRIHTHTKNKQTELNLKRTHQYRKKTHV